MVTNNTNCDEALLRQIKRNNQKALEQLFEKYYDTLCDFAFQYVKSVELSEEVVSDVFFKIWQRRNRLNISSNLRAYLYTATRNQALNYLKKERDEVESLDDNMKEVISSKEQPDEDLIGKDVEKYISFLINSLPPRRRLIFKLSRFEGFTHKEIAGILSISTQTVKNQMVSALKKLNKHI